MREFKVAYEDIPFNHSNGEVTHYNLTMAGYDMSRPTRFVLENSVKNIGPPAQLIETIVAEGIAKATDRPITSFAIFSERDHGRYELITFEERGRHPQTNEPIYAQYRDHGSFFTKEEVDKYMNQYSDEMERKRQAEENRLDRAQIKDSQESERYKKLWEKLKALDDTVNNVLDVADDLYVSDMTHARKR